mmetsp:Transcript_37633/g.49580  ORF Transcript_37633/g.49580 Transcript_37633/m.49580 type:complete len:269 (+) Transcript_37633:2088-2894(+)
MSNANTLSTNQKADVANSVTVNEPGLQGTPAFVEMLKRNGISNADYVAACDKMLEDAEEVDFIPYWNKETVVNGKKLSFVGDDRPLELKLAMSKTLLQGPDNSILRRTKTEEPLPISRLHASTLEKLWLCLLSPQDEKTLVYRKVHKEKLGKLVKVVKQNDADEGAYAALTRFVSDRAIRTFAEGNMAFCILFKVGEQDADPVLGIFPHRNLISIVGWERSIPNVPKFRQVGFFLHPFSKIGNVQVFILERSLHHFIHHVHRSMYQRL